VPDQPEPHHERFARLRRVKQLLRYMPRRAVLHKYPLVGRFAEFARKRAYLWSLKPENMRPAFYAGSILSLLPVMGIQLPIALLLSLLLRANFMVLGGLQFITNPFTAAPIYYATHQLGAGIIRATGFGASLPAENADDPNLSLEPVVETPPAAAGVPAKHPSISLTSRVGNAINALILGGVLSGIALGLLLDILYHNYWISHSPRAPRGPPVP
jgi:uncharacterized protein (DUF2062 family)